VLEYSSPSGSKGAGWAPMMMDDDALLAEIS
jgi:hypothetical protein